MASFDTPLDMQKARDVQVNATADPTDEQPTGGFTDEEILALWDVMKRESYDNRWVFERQWQRNLWYVLGRQWIEYQSKYGGWRDKRMAAWIPRPVTNKCKETVQAIRAMFTAITLSVNVRPNGSDPANVSAAATADEMAPLLHDVHHMQTAMSEFDFWLCVTGNAFLHTYLDYDIKHGVLTITAEQCLTCQTVTPSDQLTGAQPICPSCGGTKFQQATDPQTGEPIQSVQPKGIPATMVLSPLEIAFPNSYTRFDELPYVVRARWRTKRYYQSHPELTKITGKITWQKAPMDHSMALFTSLTQTNDLGITPIYWSEGSGRGGQNDEGAIEHEVWMKPTKDYPQGLVFRIIGEADPIVVHLEDEALPGPLPYTDSTGAPIFTFTHAAYEHVGGRILGSGPLDVIIQKQDQLNQLDSQVLLCLQRMANPVWLEPKGAEIQKLTGMPGLVIKWNPLTVGGNAKPERIPGIPIDASIMQLREQYLKDIEDMTGTFDIMKGQKPAGVEAFSAIQALIERSQARFASVFTSRGEAYKNWFKFAIELERKFGPEQRIQSVLTPARTWTFKTFKNAQLQGDISVVVEDGSTTPKTNLGMRAAVEHAKALGMLDMTNPDEKYEGLKLMGLTRMIPTLDIQVQSALQKQQAFEDWVIVPGNVQKLVATVQQQQMQYEQAIEAAKTAQTVGLQVAAADPLKPMPQPVQMPPEPPSILATTPLKWLPWFNAAIHLQEFLKWANDDHIRELMTTQPIVVTLLTQHMQEIQAAMPVPQQPAEKPKVSFAFSGADLTDPQVRQAFDEAAGVMGPTGSPKPIPNQAPKPEPSKPGGDKPQGAGKAMENSNNNSAPAGNKAQPEHPPGKVA